MGPARPGHAGYARPGKRRAERRYGFGSAFDVVRGGDLDTRTVSASTGREPAWREEMTATDGAREQGTGSLGGSSVPVSGLRWRRVFPGEERQLGVLRRWLALLLPDCAARDDVTCVATELGTNAVRHTASGRGGWFAVEITWHRAVVRVAVADGGAPGGPQVIGDPDGEHGRGLLVVAGPSAPTRGGGVPRGRPCWAHVCWGGT